MVVTRVCRVKCILLDFLRYLSGYSIFLGFFGGKAERWDDAWEGVDKGTPTLGVEMTQLCSGIPSFLLDYHQQLGNNSHQSIQMLKESFVHFCCP